MFSKLQIIAAQRIVATTDIIAALDLLAELAPDFGKVVNASPIVSRGVSKRRSVSRTEQSNRFPSVERVSLRLVSVSPPEQTVGGWLEKLAKDRDLSGNTARSYVCNVISMQKHESPHAWVSSAATLAARAQRARFLLFAAEHGIPHPISDDDKATAKATIEQFDGAKKSGAQTTKRQPRTEGSPSDAVVSQIEARIQSVSERSAADIRPAEVFGFLLPPRRLDPLSIRVYVSEEAAGDYAGNAFFKDTAVLRFTDFKTVDRYGVQRFDIRTFGIPVSSEAREKAIAVLSRVSNEGLLFPQKTASYNPSLYLKRELAGVTVNDLRHYWSSKTSQGLPGNRKEFLAQCQWMAHHPGTAIENYADV